MSPEENGIPIKPSAVENSVNPSVTSAVTNPVPTPNNIPPKTAPANPPTKNIFFNQPDSITSSLPAFKGGMMSKPQPEVDGETKIFKPKPIEIKQAPPKPVEQKQVWPDLSVRDMSEQNSQDPSIKPVRTYEGDVANVLSRRKTSATTMALAESKRKDGVERIGSNQSKGEESDQKSFTSANSDSTDSSSSSGTKMLIVAISILLIGGGIFGGYYLYSKSVLAPSTQGTPITTSTRVPLVPADSQTFLSIDNLSRVEILANISKELKKTQIPNTVRELILTQTTKSPTGGSQVVQVSAQDMITLLQINVPNMLERSLTSSWMLGIYSDNSGSISYFVVLTNNFFQNSFAGMLQWESIMADDLKQYIDTSSVQGIGNTAVITPLPITNATTTGTSTSTSTSRVATSTPFIQISTPTLSPYLTLRGKFVDRIVNNEVVREFQTNEGQTLFIYTFTDNTRLVFAGNEQAISEIMIRLEKAAHVR